MHSVLKIIPVLLGCLGCAVCQRHFLQASRSKDYRLAFFFKGAAGLCFVAVGVLAATECRSGAFAWRTVAGLLLGLLGDQLWRCDLSAKNSMICFSRWAGSPSRWGTRCT